jgi:cell division protein FtsB
MGVDRRRPLVFLLIVFCLLFLASYTTRLGYLRGQQRLLAQAEQQVIDAQIHTQVLESELDYVQSDAYVAEQAIEELGMALEDETVIKLVDGPETAPSSAATPDRATVALQSAAGRPVWQQWVDLFR